MKIAIVGGGFYGTFLAYKLQNSHQVSLFESDNDLMTKSALLNQCRLHQGFHYPRSPETIKQTGIGYFKFLDDFDKYTKKIDQNIYAIRKEPVGTFDLLKKNLNQEINYQQVSPPDLLRNKEEYTHFIQVDEKLILLDQLKDFLKRSLRADVHLNSEVMAIDCQTGELEYNGKKEIFDLVINTTYTNPNLGLNGSKQFRFSYELAAMVCVDIPSLKSFAITIIDGEFVSLYPNYEHHFTISSVTHTPFFKTKDQQEFQKALRAKEDLFKENDVQNKILDHASALLELPPFKIKKVWIAPKVKIDPNVNDYRAGEIKIDQKVISVFCAKLDSIYAVYEDIIEHIGTIV